MIKFCSLFSGSSGNSIYIESDDTAVLIDAGVSGKRITEALSEIGVDSGKLSAVFVSHEHSDHIKSVGVISRKYKLPVYANPGTWAAMRNMLGKVDAGNIRFFKTGETVSINGLEITSFPIPHDAAEPVGYHISDGKKSVAVATDIGHMTEEIEEKITGCELVLLESNHDIDMLKTGPYPYPLKQRISGKWGHLSNNEAGKMCARLARSGTKTVFLGHLSQINNYPHLAMLTAQNVLKKENLNDAIEVKVAEREGVSEAVEII